ncbi:MAG: aldo/keto reductase [Syntrophomonadaceae bacterium]|nr:aldo/keto reductase [Syntrophomonadaceae bacterium]
MQFVRLGNTGITVHKNGFGALPIQRILSSEATQLLRKAYVNGFNFFDTARFYTDSEQKIGAALSDVRHRIIIASKTMATNPGDFWEQLTCSLDCLRTDYIDIYQFHNPGFCPRPGDGSGLYEAMTEAKNKRLIRHIGISSHKLPVAKEAVESRLYATLQFPFSYLATEQETELVNMCQAANVGFIAMKALSGGLITNSAAAYAFLAQYPGVLPIWGIQQDAELEEFITHAKHPPVLDDTIQGIIEQDRRLLSGGFCRGCGYCLPCPAEIDIPNCARMSLLLRRAPTSIYLNDEWQEKMSRIPDCTECDHCLDNCPYGLDTPQLLKDNCVDYQSFIKPGSDN